MRVSFQQRWKQEKSQIEKEIGKNEEANDKNHTHKISNMKNDNINGIAIGTENVDKAKNQRCSREGHDEEHTYATRTAWNENGCYTKSISLKF